MDSTCEAGGALNPLNWFKGNGIICSDSFRQYESDQEQAGIMQVARNASDNYGADSITAQVAEQAAIAQSKAALTDISTINDELAQTSAGKIFGGACDDGPGLDLSIIGGPCLSYALLKKVGIGFGILVAVGMILYALGIVRSFIPSRG